MLVISTNRTDTLGEPLRINVDWFTISWQTICGGISSTPYAETVITESTMSKHPRGALSSADPCTRGPRLDATCCDLASSGAWVSDASAC